MVGVGFSLVWVTDHPGLPRRRGFPRHRTSNVKTTTVPGKLEKLVMLLIEVVYSLAHTRKRLALLSLRWKVMHPGSV